VRAGCGARGDSGLVRAEDWITKALEGMEGFEIPLAHWRVHATAFELYRKSGNQIVAQQHLALGREMIMKLANSLPVEEPPAKNISLVSDGSQNHGRKL